MAIKKREIVLIDIDNVKKEPTLFERHAEEERKLVESDAVRMIKEWRFTFGRPVNDSLTRPDNKAIMFAISMIQEEFKELTDEIFGEENEISEENIKADFPLERIADHLGDTSWVTNGMMFLFGLNPTAVVREIYKSNMSKICENEEDAALTVACYGDGTHPNKMGEEIEAAYEPIDDKFLVFRVSDKKVLKSIKFKEPDFSDM